MSRGITAFNQFYSQMWGPRWSALKEALLKPVQHFERAVTLNLPLSPQPVGCALSHEGSGKVYKMDYASVLLAQCVNVQPGHKVLDMCASPGGKSLILLEQLAGQGHITLNDVSIARCAKLRRVLKEYVPDTLASICRVTNRDASRWCLVEKNAYDCVLVDAPCSGERHLLHDESEMADWSQARTKSLQRRQVALLLSALHVVKPGGQVTYTTCSISQYENDAVIERCLEKTRKKNHVDKAGQVLKIEVASPSLSIGEPTKYGWQILPDTTGWGPIYVVCLVKGER